MGVRGGGGAARQQEGLHQVPGRLALVGGAADLHVAGATGVGGRMDLDAGA